LKREIREAEERAGWTAGPLGHIALSLLSSLREHLPYHKSSREPLVIGIYGEWGTGKSTLLRKVRDALEDTAERSLTGESQARLVIPVWFNPWRFEREQHLIVPLLKTAQASVLLWRERVARGDAGSASWLARKARELETAALALAAGLKFEFSFPGIKLGWDVEKSLNRGWRSPPNESPIGQYETVYYELRKHLQKLTESESGRQLNLVFLIDDLDRCLPDKAIEVLESIKLFLDVRGCAFVLAVDDEVVERGILHRYRDYLFNLPASAQDGNQTDIDQSGGPHRTVIRPPITGAEYLEKIVHLPFRLPLLASADVREFLTHGYPQLFGDETAEDSVAKDDTPSDTPLGRQGPDRNQRADAAEARQRERLLELFINAVPPVPRKLIRAAELLALMLDVADKARFRDYNRLTLARLVMLQLFAPQMYRFARRNPAFLFAMQQWNRDFGGFDPVAIRARIRSDPSGDEGLFSGLLAQILSARESRGGFDPWALLGPPEIAGTEEAEIQNLRPYLSLVEEGGESMPATASAHARTSEAGQPRDVARFVEQLASGDRVLVSNALAQDTPSCAGRTLSDEIFRRLQSALSEKTDPPAVEWCEQVAEILSPKQLLALIKKTGLLHRLAEQLTQTPEQPSELPPLSGANAGLRLPALELRTALELICTKHNPPFRPVQHRVSLAELGLEQLSWERIPLAGIQLRGLDFGQEDLSALAPDALNGADLEGADLSGATLGTLELTRARLLQTRLPPNLFPTAPHLGSYLAADRALPVLPVSGAGDSVLAVLRDGRLVSGCEDGSLRLWDPEAGRMLMWLDKPSSIIALAALPTGRFASAAWTEVDIWDVDSGREPLTTLPVAPGAGMVRSLAAMPSGRLAGGDESGVVHVWDPDSGQLEAEAHTGKQIRALGALSDTCVASGAEDGIVRVWNLDAAHPASSPITELAGHQGAIRALAVCEGGLLASASEDKTIRIWEVAGPTGAEHARAAASSEELKRTPRSVIEGHQGPVNSLLQLYDRSLASGSDDQSVRIWDFASGRTVSAWQGLQGPVTALAQLAGGRLAVAHGGTVGDWHPATGKSRLSLGGNRNGVLAVATVGNQLVSGHRDGSVLLWPAGNEAPLSLDGHRTSVTALATLSNGRFASGSARGGVRLWDAATGEALATLQHGNQPVESIAALDERRIAVGFANGTLQVWEPDSGHARLLVSGYKGSTHIMVALPNGDIVLRDLQGKLHLVDAETGSRRSLRPGTQVESGFERALVLPDGRLLLGYSTGMLHMIDLERGESETLAAMSSASGALAVLPDGRIAVAVYEGIALHRPGAKEQELKMDMPGEHVYALAALGEDRLAALSERGASICNLREGTRECVFGSSTREVAYTVDSAGVHLYRLRGSWRTVSVGGETIPADPDLHHLAGFNLDNRFSAPLYAIPERLSWGYRKGESEPNRVTVAWPRELAPQALPSMFRQLVETEPLAIA